MEPQVTKTKREPEGGSDTNGAARAANGASFAASPENGPAGNVVPPKEGRRGYLIVAGVAAAIGLGVAGYMFFTAGEESTDDAQVSADVVPIGLRVGGLVTKVFVQDNQLVKKGDPLAEIDDADFVAREKQAEAELATADAHQVYADRGFTPLADPGRYMEIRRSPRELYGTMASTNELRNLPSGS